MRQPVAAAALLTLLGACSAAPSVAPVPQPSAVQVPAQAPQGAPPVVIVPVTQAVTPTAVPSLPAIPLATSEALPAGMTFTSDVPQVTGLVAALQRRPIEVALPGDLAGSLTGGGSGNAPLAEGANALLDFERRHVPLSNPQYAALVANWRKYYLASRTNWMGDEMLSCIYGGIHLMSNMVVVGWSSRNGGALDDSRRWVSVWWQLADLMATPQGYLATIGERCGGHSTTGRDRAILSYLYAVAGAPGTSVATATAWCQQGGAGLRPHGSPAVGSWEYPAAQALAPVLLATYAERHRWPLAGIKFEQPLFGVRTPAGDFAYWLGTARNFNTPPVLAVVYLRNRGDGPGAPQYLPVAGGPHFRQQKYVSTVTHVGDTLVFVSTMQGNGTLALPAGAGPVQVFGQ